MENKTSVLLFSEWIRDNYTRISAIYDKDLLHDSIIIAYEIINNKKNICSNDFQKLLKSIYLSRKYNKFYSDMVYMFFDDSTLEWIIDQNTREEEQPESRDWFGMLEYAKRKMTKKHTRLIDLHVKGLSVKNISMCTGLSATVISKELKICKSYIYNSIIKNPKQSILR